MFRRRVRTVSSLKKPGDGVSKSRHSFLTLSECAVVFAFSGWVLLAVWPWSWCAAIWYSGLLGGVLARRYQEG